MIFLHNLLYIDVLQGRAESSLQMCQTRVQFQILRLFHDWSKVENTRL